MSLYLKYEVLVEKRDTTFSFFKLAGDVGRKWRTYPNRSQSWWQRDQKTAKIPTNMGQKSKYLHIHMVHAKYLETLSLAIFIGDFYMLFYVSSGLNYSRKPTFSLSLIILWFQTAVERGNPFDVFISIIQVQSISSHLDGAAVPICLVVGSLG